MNKNTKIFTLLITFIMLSSSVSAFAVSAPFIENNVIKLSPGGTIDLEFVLQDSGAISDFNARVEITAGKEIAEITDSSNIYFLPKGEKVKVHVRITVPEEAEVGDKYNLRIGFSKSGAPGAFTFGISIDQSFTIEIIGALPPPEPTPELAPETPIDNTTLWIIAVAILILIVLIFLYLRKKRKEVTPSTTKKNKKNFK